MSRNAPSPSGARPAVAPNLARRPFVNRRPVARLALLLGIAGVLLFVLNLYLYVDYVRTRSANAAELREIEASIAEESVALEEAEDELARTDLERQNELVRFLNRRIDERTFGWSVLFDRLADLLPNDVRIQTLAPSFSEWSATAGRAGAGGADESVSEAVRLSIQGRARRAEAILELVDALFADPAFTDPNLLQESTDRGETSFGLTVVYLPAAAEDRHRGDGAGPAGVEVALDDGVEGGAAADSEAADSETGDPETGDSETGDTAAGDAGSAAEGVAR